MTFGGYAFDIYAYNAPNGARLVRLTPSKTVTLACRLPEQGFGMADGQIVIHSDHVDATAANFHKHNLVKVVALDGEGDEMPMIWQPGFFLEEGDFAALSTKERGGRMLSFRGPNTLYYLERAILREQPFSENPAAGTVRGAFDVDGMWTWIDDGSGVNAEPGGIMVRGLEEGFYQPGPSGTSADAPLKDATWDFTRFVDSNGVGWTPQASHWQVPWGRTTILDLQILMRRAGLFWRSGADLDYHAYATDPAVDRTSATFAAGKVRFEAGVNVVTAVTRDITASVERSAVLVTGAENATAYVDGGASDVTWIGHVDVPSSSEPATLEGVGEENLDAREVLVEAAFPLRHIVADDEENGGYVPFVHYVPGDIVTLQTGPDEHDFTEFAIPAKAVRILHDAAGNWFGMPELGAQALSADSKAFEERVNRIIRQAGGHSHPPNPELCPPAKACVDLIAIDLTAGTATNGDVESGATNWSGGATNTTYKHGGTQSYAATGVTSCDLIYDFGSQLFLAGIRYVIDIWLYYSSDHLSTIVTFGDEGGDEESRTYTGNVGADPIDLWDGSETGADGNTWRRSRVCWTPSEDRTNVRVRFQGSANGSQDIAVDDLALYTTDNSPLAGTDPHASRCGHGHYAREVVFQNAGTGLDATNVQQLGVELADRIAAIGELPDLAEKADRGAGLGLTVEVVSDAGAAHTLDMTYTHHRLTLTEACTITIPTVTTGGLLRVHSLELIGDFDVALVSEDGTVTLLGLSDLSADGNALRRIAFDGDDGINWQAKYRDDTAASVGVWHPVMAQDPGGAEPDRWWVVVDGSGTAVMTEAP